MQERIRKLLAKDSRPSSEIGRLTGIHPVNVRQFKAGTRQLPFSELSKLAKVLGYRLDVQLTKSH